MVSLKIELPEHFLEEEVRCGYCVPAEMKKLWAVELDLTAELLRVCKKYGLPIYASGGTELGAIRHKGFIPWDDDIDFMMTREAYDRLCEVAPEEFQAPYFFQTEYTDPGSLRKHAQLRNSETTAILESELDRKYSFNQGIFLDIFPMDYVTDDPQKLAAQGREMERCRKIYLMLSRLSSRYSTAKGGGLKKAAKAAVHSIFAPLDRRLGITDHWYRKFEKTCARYNGQPTAQLGKLFFGADNCWPLPTASFEHVLWVPFENIEIPVAADYDLQLRSFYGDYMQFVKGTSYHGGLAFSAEIPYTQYLKGLKSGE